MSGEKPEESVPPVEAAASEEAEQAQSSSQTNATYDAEKTEQLMAMMEKLAMLNQQNGGLPVRNMETALGKKYQFWDTQPMPKFTENPTENTWIEPNVPVDKVRAEPYSLPSAFLWSDVDLNNEAQLEELYQLLTENYVEDDDNMFRFDYSKDFLRWALLVPGWRPEWHIGVRAQQSGRLVAFISAIPQAIRVYDLERKMVEINFLCVHKKLRSKRVAPVLIREVTRRVNLTGIFQAAFTAGAVLPKPVGICRYWHRSLNPKKLIDVRFSHLAKNMTIARTIKLYKLPDSPSVALRPMEKRDVGQAHALLADHLKQYKLAPHFTKKEFEHIFLPRDNVVYSYVLEKENRVTDFVSFYSLPSSVMNHPQHKTLRAAYSYYWVAGSIPIKQLMNDALILANREGFDVFNALDLMHNSEVLEELKFGIGDGNLQYYIYNWKCPEMQPNQIGLVLQ